MSTRYTLTGLTEARQEIKKSRFLAAAAPVSTEADAKAFLQAHAHHDAGHNCWAWKIGNAYRFSDDGEPSGTAGKPILQAIEGQSLDGVVVVVSRWFGGILLGSGGLVRAYGGTAAQCLREAEKALLVEKTTVEITCNFSDLALLQSRLTTFDHAVVLHQTFTETGATLTVSMAKYAVTDMARYVIDSTSGRATVEQADE